MPDGTPIAKFSLATNERYKNRAGEWVDKTEWTDIVAWAGLAEICGKFVKKGSRICVEGKLSTSSWDDKDTGKKRYRTEVVASEVVLLDKPSSSGQPLSQEEAEELVPF
jgi:single-strand DNA-binding protein